MGRQLVKAGRYGSELLESAEAPFDDVAVLVRFRVEGGWPAAPGAPTEPVGDLVLGVDQASDGGLVEVVVDLDEGIGAGRFAELPLLVDANRATSRPPRGSPGGG